MKGFINCEGVKEYLIFYLSTQSAQIRAEFNEIKVYDTKDIAQEGYVDVYG